MVFTLPAIQATLDPAVLPRWRRVRQRFEGPQIPDVPAAMRAQLDRDDTGGRIQPGMQVAIGVGSRGISSLPEVVRATVDAVRRRGGEPFIVPAMGSHGGGVAEAQAGILAHYGITEETVGAPVRATMDVVELGQLPDGTTIYWDRIAAGADAVIPINRVKPHTDYHGPVESGVQKMLTIGLGKRVGCDALHTIGVEEFSWLIPAAAALVMEQKPVIFGVALVENGYHQTAIVEAIPAERLPTREPELLKLAWEWMPKLPFERLDVLIVDEMGKAISGSGMDTNVIGRYEVRQMTGGPDIQRVVPLRLAPGTDTNACGIGLADITTRQLVEDADWHATYVNCAAGHMLDGARMPMVAETERDAVLMAVQSGRGMSPERLSLVRIKNTLALEEFYISESLADHPGLKPVGPWTEITFDDRGCLAE